MTLIRVGRIYFSLLLTTQKLHSDSLFVCMLGTSVVMMCVVGLVETCVFFVCIFRIDLYSFLNHDIKLYIFELFCVGLGDQKATRFLRFESPLAQRLGLK